MKTLTIATITALLLVACQPAEAKGLFRKVLGAPFWVLGFTATMVADITVVPFIEGNHHYVETPTVSKKLW